MIYDGKRTNRYGTMNRERGTGTRGSACRGAADSRSAGCQNAGRGAAGRRSFDRKGVEPLGQSPVIGKRLSPKAREVFLEGLRRYQERGVRILLDGKEADVNSLEVIFEEREDGSFYMGDYILAEEEELALRTRQECCSGCEIMELHENRSGYRTQGEGMDPAADAGARKAGGQNGKGGVKCLKEIRFDRVYNR